MLYKLPDAMQQSRLPHWPSGVRQIGASLSDGSPLPVPVIKGVNQLILGEVGTGKTNSYILPASEALLDSNPQTRAAFFDPKRTFIDHFMQLNDKVITHNPRAVPACNLFKPSIIKEIRQSTDSEAELRDISEFLYSSLLDGAGQNRAWVESARNTFAGVLRVIIECYPRENTSNYSLVNALRRMTAKELLTYLAKHPRNRSMLQKDWGYDYTHPDNYKPSRRATDILFFFNKGLEAFSGAFEMDGTDTIHDWLNGNYGRHLFFLYDLASATISKPFFLYYLKKIKDFKMSNSFNSSRPILLVMDEIDKLSCEGKSADWGLFQAANLGREAGLQILLGTQSVENLFGMSTDYNEHNTIGGLAGFPIIICFRPGDPTTIKTLQTLFGSTYKEHVTLPASRYNDPVMKYELEPFVTDADFASLDTGDCFIKIMSANPQRVHINRSCF